MSTIDIGGIAVPLRVGDVPPSWKHESLLNTLNARVPTEEASRGRYTRSCNQLNDGDLCDAFKINGHQVIATYCNNGRCTDAYIGPP